MSVHPIKAIFGVVAGVLLSSSSVQASFVLQNNFPSNLNEQVTSLAQFEGKSVSIEESSSMNDVMSALLWEIAPHIQESPDYRMPFAVNCSIFFYTQIEKIICDVAFENIEEIAGSCASDRQFPVSYLEQLQKNHILQTHTVVGLAPIQHPQSLYWLYFKLPPTPTASVSQMLTESVSESPSSTETIVASATKSLTQSETLSQNRSISPSESLSLSGCPIPPVAGLLASWNASTGVYADATNQTNRYNLSNWTALDTLTGITWEQNMSSATMNFTQAQSYCANRTTGGRSSWRVPNVVELNTMYDYTLGSPYVNTTVFPGTTAVSFWSASPDVGHSGYAWDLELGNQYTYYSTNNTAEAVRCVIACSPIPPASRYMNASGEVTDLVTGLIWQQVSGGSTFNQTSAVAHCAEFGLNDHSWRLPTARELVTLVDYNASYNTLMMNQTVFAGEPANEFWSSTPVTGYATDALYVQFNIGLVLVRNLASSYCVRCVRSNTAVPTAAPSSTPLTYNCTAGLTTPPTNGLLAAWNASSGVYADATNQTNRYNLSNWTALDTLTGIIWEQNVSSSTMNFTQAQSYCANRTTGGRSGWRVPNVVELNTMYDYTLGSPYVNTTVFPGTTAVSFWSASPDVGHSGFAWDLELGSQETYYVTNGTAERVRCVTACYPIPPVRRYVNASGEVVDLVTGLIWQQVSGGSTFNQTSAVAHCAGFGLNNHTWRLPMVRELQTLVDYNASYSSLMMNQTVFAGEPAKYFWSSTPVAGVPSGAWYVSFAYGGLLNFIVTSDYYVRCVR